jgi:hypothetical protein
LSTHGEDPNAAYAGAPGSAQGEPTEEELRALYEAELSRITVTDMLAQAAVSLLNIAARRVAPSPPPGAGAGAAAGAPASGAGGASPGDGAGAPDLDQVRDGIDAVRALLEILERRIPQEVRPLRDALSQLQIAYAAAVNAAEQGSPTAASEGQPPGGEEKPGSDQAPSEEAAPGPAQSSGRLWVPGS